MFLFLCSFLDCKSLQILNKKSRSIKSFENNLNIYLNKMTKKQASLEEAVFCAIDTGFVEGIKFIVKNNNITDMVSTSENIFTSDEGVTPIQFSSYKNNYQIYKILFENGHCVLVCFLFRLNYTKIKLKIKFAYYK